MPKSYIYDRITGVYLGEGSFSLNHKYEPIIGAYETTEPPPEFANNRVARYLDENGIVPTHHGVNNASWVTHYNYKGKKYYTSTGEEKEITEYNVDIPAGTITNPPPGKYYNKHNGIDWIYNPALHVADRCAEVNKLLEEKYKEGFSYGENRWQIDSESQNKISARAFRAFLSISNPEAYEWTIDVNTWRTFDNEDIVFETPEHFIDFSEAVHNYCEKMWKTAANHKDNIRKLTKESDISSYDIEDWD